MADQIIPITGLDRGGVIKDAPPVTLPPNLFSDVRNVRFKDGSVRKMEGEVNIFPSIFNGTANGIEVPYNGSTLKYIIFWQNPNVSISNKGYYVYIVQEQRRLVDGAYVAIADDTSIEDQVARDVVYVVLPNGTPLEKGNFTAVSNNVGRWQHTFFQGGFCLIINNGLDEPHYIIDQNGNTNTQGNASTIALPAFAPLPGWQSYNSKELVESRTAAGASETFTFASPFSNTLYDVIVEVNGNSYATFTTTAADGEFTSATVTGLTAGQEVSVYQQSADYVNTRCGVIRSFGDFLVAGNIIERDVSGQLVLRNLPGVIKTSDVAPPGSIPQNWDPFAAGVNTADEFVLSDTGIVQDMAELQGSFYIYSNTSISSLRQTGNAAAPFTSSTVTSKYGAQALGCVLEFDGRHFIVGSNDIYIFGGHPGSIQSVADGRVRRYFYDNLNPLFDQSFFCLRYAQRDEIWICFPNKATGTGEANLALIWNYRLDNWTIRDLYGVVAGDTAPVPGGGLPSASLTLTGTDTDGDPATSYTGNRGITKVGTFETRTLGIDPTLTTNGDLPDGQHEIQEIVISDLVPEFETNGKVIFDFIVGPDFDSGPSPQAQVTQAHWVNQAVDDLAALELHVDYTSEYNGATDHIITGANLGLSGAGNVDDFYQALRLELDKANADRVQVVQDALGWVLLSTTIQTDGGTPTNPTHYIEMRGDPTVGGPFVILTPYSDTLVSTGVLFVGTTALPSSFVEITRGIDTTGAGSSPGFWEADFVGLDDNDTTTPQSIRVVFPAGLRVDTVADIISYNLDANGNREYVADTTGTNRYEATVEGLTSAIVDILNANDDFYKYFFTHQLFDPASAENLGQVLYVDEFVIETRAAQGDTVENVAGVTDYIYPTFTGLSQEFDIEVGSGVVPDERVETSDEAMPLTAANEIVADANNTDPTDLDNYSVYASRADVGDKIYYTEFTLELDDLTVGFNPNISLTGVDSNNVILEFISEWAGEADTFEGDADDRVYEGDATDAMYEDLVPTWTRITPAADENYFYFLEEHFRPNLDMFAANDLVWRIRIPASENYTLTAGDSVTLEAHFESQAVSTNGGNADISEGAINRRGVTDAGTVANSSTAPIVNIVSVPVEYRFGTADPAMFDTTTQGTVESDDDLFYSDGDTSVVDADPMYDNTALGEYQESSVPEEKVIHSIALAGDYTGDDRFRKIAVTLRDSINTGVLGLEFIAVHLHDAETDTHSVQLVSRAPRAYEVRLADFDLDGSNPIIDSGTVGLLAEHFTFTEVQHGITPITGDDVYLPYLYIEGPDNFGEGFRLTNTNDDKNQGLTASQIINQICQHIENHIASQWNYTTLGRGYTQLADTSHARTITIGPRAPNKETVVAELGDNPTGLYDRYPVDTTPFSVTVTNYGNNGSNESNFDLTLLDSVENDTIYTLDVSGLDRDVRGSFDERAQETIIAIVLIDPSIASGEQLLLFVGGSEGEYNVDTHTGTNGASQTNEGFMSNFISFLRTNAPSVSAVQTSTTQVSLQPAFYDETSVFVGEIASNITETGAARVAELMGLAAAGETLEYHPATQTPSFNKTLDAIGDIVDDGVISVQSIAPTFAGTNDPQSVADDASDRVPGYESNSYNTTTLKVNADIVQTNVFDIERPWPIDEVNPNLQYPIFAETALINGVRCNKITAADIGWSIPAFSTVIRTDTEIVGKRSNLIEGNDERLPYASYVERTQLPVTPEFLTDQVKGMALWLDGRTQAFYNGPELRNRMELRLATTNNPGVNAVLNSATTADLVNGFYISEDYKVDTRVTGRFINLRLTDAITDTTRDVEPIDAVESSTNFNQKSEWRLSGMQTIISNRGER